MDRPSGEGRPGGRGVLLGLGRNGETPDKLHFYLAARCSEDIDLVQMLAEPIGDTLNEIRQELDPWRYAAAGTQGRKGEAWYAAAGMEGRRREARSAAVGTQGRKREACLPLQVRLWFPVIHERRGCPVACR